MSYTSRSNRPNEYANKSNHTHLINDKAIQAFLDKCVLPNKNDDNHLKESKLLFELEKPNKNPIKYIIAIDGGFTPIEVEKRYPSSTIAFLQFGAFILNLEDWTGLNNQAFISPEDMSKFNHLERIKLIVPTKLVSLKNEASFSDSFRKTIYEFFMKENEGGSLMETLKWLVFEDYNSKKSNDKDYIIQNPNNKTSEPESISLRKSEMNSNYTFTIMNEKVYLTDIFRFHEKIDDELGAEGVLGNLSTLIEQIIFVDYIRQILRNKPQMLNEILFIKDGSLAFYDVTARLHIPMRKLMRYLFENHSLYLIGLEKSGPFTDHALSIATETIEEENIKSLLPRNHYLLMSNDYIYKYITPGDTRRMIYGRTTHYSGKVIFKTATGNTFVACIPWSVIEPKEYEDAIRHPSKGNFNNIDILLYNLGLLKCEMYDNALVPVTLVNKLVSLADHPSQRILEKFAKDSIKK